MSAFVYRSSRPHESILPRAHRDAHQRFQVYGPIQPMDRVPSLIDRIFGRSA